MKNWPLSKKVALIAALFAVYFPIAAYFKHTYVPQPGPSKETIWLTGPFLPFVEGGVGARRESSEQPVGLVPQCHRAHRPSRWV